MLSTLHSTSLGPINSYGLDFKWFLLGPSTPSRMISRWAWPITMHPYMKQLRILEEFAVDVLQRAICIRYLLPVSLRWFKNSCKSNRILPKDSEESTSRILQQQKMEIGLEAANLSRSESQFMLVLQGDELVCEDLLHLSSSSWGSCSSRAHLHR